MQHFTKTPLEGGERKELSLKASKRTQKKKPGSDVGLQAGAHVFISCHTQICYRFIIIKAKECEEKRPVSESKRRQQEASVSGDGGSLVSAERLTFVHDMLSDSEAVQLLSFLAPETRLDVKAKATEYILGLSGNRDGCQFLCSKPNIISALLALTSDPSVAIVKDCYHVLINLSADETLHQVLVCEVQIVPVLLKNLLDPDYLFSDQIASILSNLSRHEETCRTVFTVLQEQAALHQLVDIICNEHYNPRAKLHFLGPLLSNLTQLPEARALMLDRDRCVIQRLLPFTQYDASLVKRGGVIGTLRNCCFDHTHHEWLLSDAVDILPFLLLPLAGPEELTEEENEGLPVDLQYLPEDKKREEDPDIRKMLLETLLLLTATKAGRQTLKERNVYPIMREFHRWEKDVHVSAACEKLVQVLIGDEPEQGMENLMQVEIPEEVEKMLKQADIKEQEELEKAEKRIEGKEKES